MKILLYVINLQTYIVEYRNYTELQRSKMQPRTMVLEGIMLLSIKDAPVAMRRLRNVDRKGWLRQASGSEWTIATL